MSVNGSRLYSEKGIYTYVKTPVVQGRVYLESHCIFISLFDKEQRWLVNFILAIVFVACPDLLAQCGSSCAPLFFPG